MLSQRCLIVKRKMVDLTIWTIAAASRPVIKNMVKENGLMFLTSCNHRLNGIAEG